MFITLEYLKTQKRINIFYNYNKGKIYNCDNIFIDIYISII